MKGRRIYVLRCWILFPSRVSCRIHEIFDVHSIESVPRFNLLKEDCVPRGRDGCVLAARESYSRVISAKEL
ncbi:hypothetical protein DFJ58DRAFT_783224 [Suillus subalutaceus]|uniref:uncharacterized protein n=1 Tax=Suillus subalutaceus TaxID=48586 RepID=UPI001B874E13|nr:uncharacterized protein DFJ58DRAFT_783224 [Suillus subalutaceus]KAG1857753.1 hypothetical protein DFJ58DRAFT_783224 [Suillus subalutaceus]